VVFLGVQLRARAAEAHHAARAGLIAHLAQEEEEQHQNQQPGTPEDQEVREQRVGALVARALLGLDVEAVRNHGHAAAA